MYKILFVLAAIWMVFCPSLVSAQVISTGNKLQVCDSVTNCATITSGALNVNATVNSGPTNVTQINSVAAVTAAAGVLRVGLADGSGNIITSTSNALNVSLTTAIPAGTNFIGHVTCDSGCSTLSLTTDSTTFTPSVSGMSPIGAFYHSVRDTAVNDAVGAVAMNANRSLLVQLEDSGKNAINSTGNALNVNISSGSIANTSFIATQATGTNLHVVCDSGCSTSTAPADNSAFTAGTTSASPVAGFYHATRDSLTNDSIGAIALNVNRAVLVQLEDSSKNAISSTSNALNINISSGSIGNTSFISTQATAANLNATVVGTGTFATQSAITAASSSVASGAFASGALSSGSIASGAIASGAVASGAYASGSVSDGAVVTLGAKADAKNTATDTTAITVMQVLKEISYMEQNPASQAVTGTVTATQATGSNLHVVCDSGCSGSTAPTDNTAFTAGTTPTTPIAGFYHSTRDTVTSGDLANIAINANRAVLVQLEDSSKNAINSTNNALNVVAPGITYNSTPTTLTNSQVGDFQIDNMQALKVVAGDNGFNATVVGAKTNNNAAPGATNLGVLPCIANAAAPTDTEGDQSLCSENLAGAQRVVLNVTATAGETVSTSYLAATASTNSTSVKGSAGNVYFIHATNTTATLYYLRMYNSSSAPTCSSATGFIETMPIPASATGAGFVREIPVGQGYSTGIGFCITGGGSSTDNTNAAAGVYLTIGYK